MYYNRAYFVHLNFTSELAFSFSYIKQLFTSKAKAVFERLVKQLLRI